MSQVPVASSTPIVSQVPVATTTPIVSQVPMASPQPMMIDNSHFANNSVGTLVDEDYRLGRGILDEFRPAPIKASMGLGGNMVVNTAMPVATTTPLVSTPVVSTPAVVPTGGANVLKDFL